jgi:hypothetical protein
MRKNATDNIYLIEAHKIHTFILWIQIANNAHPDGPELITMHKHFGTKKG